MGMTRFKPQRGAATPIRQLIIVIAVTAVFFLISQQHPLFHQGESSQHLPASQSEPILSKAENTTRQDIRQVIPLSEASAPEKAETCQRYIFYDKPVKTGSTAVTDGIEKYLDSISENAITCVNLTDCTRVGEEVCAGNRPLGHLIQHILFNSSTALCLRNKGYYYVTSIREPKERIISAWRFSLTKKVSHYGISYNATFDQFLELFPRCSLYAYYDLLPAHCTQQEAEQRAEEIVSRFDEVIDLSDTAITDVHQRIQPFLRNVNVAPSGRAQTGELEVPDHVVDLEYLLYNKLREKRVSLVERPRRTLCQR